MPNSPLDYEVLVQEIYEAILRNGDVAIDVGAHRGRHAVAMAAKVFPAGQVLAFEPLPMCREELENEIADYRPELANILKVHPCALGDFTGQTEFVVAKDALAYSGLKKRQYDTPTEVEQIPIEVKRLDDCCAHLPAVRFIKIDAEGGEFHILKGAVRTLTRCRPAVAFEFGANSIAEYLVTPLQMARFWSELGYKVYNILGASLTEREFVTSSEVQTLWDYVAVPAEDVALQQTIVGVLTRVPDWHRVAHHLDAAHHQVNLASGKPKLVGFRGVKGWLVKRMAKLIFGVNQAVAGPQRACSQSLMYSGRAMLEILRERAREATCQAAQLSGLADQVAEMRQKLMLQEQNFVRQSELLAEARNQLAKLAGPADNKSEPGQSGLRDQAA